MRREPVVMQLEHDVAVHADGLGLRYDGASVLSGVGFALPRGAVLGLVGRNGAGKSTLLRCLVGLSVPQEGHATVLGRDAMDLDDATREQLGYAGQQADLLEWLTVWEQVRYIGSFYPRWDETRARGLLIRFGLAEGLHVGRLSMGDQQKLALVLALAHDPQVAILDEPVASLDPMARRDFLRTLFEGNGERTVILSSHLLLDLERAVSHMLFLRAGQVQWFGERDALTEHVVSIESTQALPAQPGLLAQRRVGEQWRSLIDLRLAVPALAQAPSLRALDLDDLFVEFNA
jgi:ABC-2 type transport system ATP-binding protein